MSSTSSLRGSLLLVDLEAWYGESVLGLIQKKSPLSMDRIQRVNTNEGIFFTFWAIIMLHFFSFFFP